MWSRFSYSYCQRRDQPKLPINWVLTTLIWAIAGATASAVVYGIAPYNLLKVSEKKLNLALDNN